MLFDKARQFFDKFSNIQSTQHDVDVRQLKSVVNKDQLNRSGIRDAYIGTKFNVKLAEESYRSNFKVYSCHR